MFHRVLHTSLTTAFPLNKLGLVSQDSCKGAGFGELWWVLLIHLACWLMNGDRYPRHQNNVGEHNNGNR